MKRNILFLLILFPSFFFCQEISFSKDSLNIISRYQEGYNGSLEFVFYDSLLIKNPGDDLLVIDSVITENIYSYRLKVETKDSVYYTILYNYEWLFSLSISPKDSVKIIFADADLCPICKTKSLIETFVDKFYFYSNALNNKISEIAVKGEGFSVGVNEQIAAPTVFKLNQNCPNPFNPTTTISFVIPNEVRNIKDTRSTEYYSVQQNVTLKVYDILGREVATLVNEQKPAGNYEVKFDASRLASGIYFYKLSAGSFTKTKKMILLR